MPTYAENRKARHDFEILDILEAGLVLAGHEVKSIRAGRVKLDGGYVLVRGGEAFLVGITIPPYQVANTPASYDPERPRKLLLNKKELAKLERETETARLTAVPIKLYNKNQKIKLTVAIARGKKKYDKRETIKARDTDRELKRTLKQHT